MNEPFIHHNANTDLRSILQELPHKVKVEFALYCVKDCYDLTNEETRESSRKCIELVEKWLTDEKLVSKAELRSTANAAWSAAHAASAAANVNANAAWSAANAARSATAAAAWSAWSAWSAASANENTRKQKEEEYLQVAQNLSSRINKANIDLPNEYQIELLKKVDVGRMLDILQDLGHSPFTHKDVKYHLDLFGGISGESPSEIASEIERRHLAGIFRNIVLSSFDK